ncbi:MAG TPA: hypothetical protein VI489_03575 [Candidatus Brocadiaceae bacterium]
MQPTSGGSGDCHEANHPGYDQDATEEALPICQIEELELMRAYSPHKSGETDFVYACLSVKNIGKPCAGKPHARFDEGGQDYC